MFKLNLIEGLKNIDKNKFLACLSMILFTFLFILQSYTFSYYSVSDFQYQSASHETIQNYSVYCLLGSFGIYELNSIEPDLKQNIKQETLEFHEALSQIEGLSYICLKEYTLCLNNFKSDSNSFIEFDFKMDPDASAVKALACTPNFHNVESYRIIKGRNFTDEDMIYVEGKPRPVLLGYKYKDIYEPGDIIEMYKFEDIGNDSYVLDSIEVIGILAEDSTVLDHRASKVIDLDNLIIYPRVTLPCNDFSSYDIAVQEIAMNADYKYISKIKFLVNSEKESEVIAEIQKALNEYSSMAKYYNISNRSEAVTRYHARTEAVSQFAFGITAVLMVSAVITVIFSVINRIENNLKDYAIHISIGASSNNIIGFVISETVIILSCSVALGLIFSKWLMAELYMPYYFLEFLGIFAVTSLLVIILSAITAKLALKKYDLCTLIK